MKQHRLTPGPLLDKAGHLCEKGYATSLVRTYDRTMVRGGLLRLKEWDYYLITNEHYGIALTLADNGYMGMAGASILRFDEPRHEDASVIKLMTRYRTNMPPDSSAGEIPFNWKGAHGCFSTKDGVRQLHLHLDSFNGKPFDARFTLTDPPQDTMVIATPFAQKSTAFYYNQKIIGMSAEGRVLYGDEVIDFSAENTQGMLDWGRGVWTYENTWYWCAAQGTVGGKKFGFNLGYGFGDTSAASENMLFYEGRAHKLELIDFGIPTADDGSDDYMSPWHFTSSDGRFDAIFTPLIDRHTCTNVGPLLSEPHQVFGHFDGYAVLDDGTRIPLEHFPGFAEKVHNKW